jgi:hypothetical protein
VSAIGELVFFGTGFALTAAFYIFGRFVYIMRADGFTVRRYVFWVVPFGTRRFQTSEIAEVRRCDFKRDWLRGAEIFGNLFWKPGVMVITKRGFWRRFYLTPPDPDAIVTMLEKQPASPLVRPDL